jgi:hypothetical protein
VSELSRGPDRRVRDQGPPRGEEERRTEARRHVDRQRVREVQLRKERLVRAVAADPVLLSYLNDRVARVLESLAEAVLLTATPESSEFSSLLRGRAGEYREGTRSVFSDP